MSPPPRVGWARLVVGMFALALVVAGIGVVHRLAAHGGRQAVSAFVDGIGRDPDEPRFGPPDGGALPMGSPIPVLAGRAPVADLACRPLVGGVPGGHVPLVADPGGRAKCWAVWPTENRFTLQLVRLGPDRTVVREYPPVTLTWTFPADAD